MLGDLSGSGTVNASTGTATINVGALNVASDSFAGVISGAVGVNKVGTGSWSLTGNSNSYTAATTVTAGALVVSNSAGSATGSGNVTLNGGTFASGTIGTISGNLLAGTGAHTIAPGGVGTVGTLAVGGLTSNGNTTIAFDLGTTNVGTGTDGSPIDGGGDLFNLGSGTVSIGTGTVLSFNAALTTVGTDYRLFGGTVSGLSLGAFVLPSAPAGHTYSLSSTVDPGYVDLLDVGSRNLTFNNTGGTGDGTTFDTIQQNFNNGAGPSTFNGVGDTVTFNDTNNGHYAVNVPSTVTPAGTIVTTANTYTFSGAGGIGGIGGLTVNGTGRVVMRTSNSYTGVTNVSSGTLAVGNPNALGAATAPLLVNGGTVDVAGYAVATGTLNLLAGSVTDTAGTGSLSAAAFNVSGGTVGVSLAGAGGLTKLTSSTFALTTSNTYTGGTTVAAGTLTVANASALGSTAGNLLLSGGTLDLDGHAVTSGTFTLAGGSVTDSTSSGTALTATAFNVSAGTLGVTLTGPGVLNKIGTGTYSLTASNSFTGGTNVVAGTLTILNPAGLGPTTNALTVSGGTLDQNGNSLTVGLITLNGGTITDSTSTTTTLTGSAYNLNSGAVNVPLVGPAGVTVFGSTGAVTLNAANTYTGGTNVGAGTLIVNGNQSAASGGWLVGPTALYNATANFASGSTVVSTGLVQIGSVSGGTGTVTLNVAGSATNSGSLYVGRSGIMNVSSGGTWTQTGPAGIVSQNGYQAYMTVVTGGTFNYAGSSTFNLSGGTNAGGVATLALAGGTFNTNQGLLATTPAANGNFGALLTLSAGGTIRLTADVPSLTAVASGAIPIFNISMGTAGGTIDTNGHATAVQTAVIGTGGLTKAGTGTLALNAANTYSGGTTVNAGTLQANAPLVGTVTSSATGTALVTVNSGATLAGNGGTGAVSVASGGFITAGTGRTASDQISALTTTTQSWASGGTYVAKVAAIDPTTPASNVSDQLVMSGLTVASGFSVALLNTTGSNITFGTANTDTSGTLGSATPGSYVVIAKDSEGGASPFNSPSAIAALNLNFTHAGFATTNAASTIQLAGVSDGGGYDLIAEDVSSAPEPTSLLLAALAAAPLALGRRRRERSASR